MTVLSIKNMYIKQHLSPWQPNSINTQISCKGLTMLIPASTTIVSHLTCSQTKAAKSPTVSLSHCDAEQQGHVFYKLESDQD